jgi:hypothetical protein
MTDVSKNVIKKIKKDKIEPHSKKRFFLKKSVTWILFGLSILLGIVACSVAIFQIKHAEWDLYHLLNYTLLRYILLILPYFWLFFLFVFMAVAYSYFRRTERGYRIKPVIVVLSSILISVIGGFLLYQTGFSERLESVFQENVPVYRWVNYGRRRVWMSPRQGLLAGEIIKIISPQQIGFKDLQGKNWLVDISNTIWRGRLRPDIGLKIKLIGKMSGRHQFVASEIRPLFGRGYGRRRGMRNYGRGRRDRLP